ncbi:alpha-glucuronidase [Aspergillus mulundensis]|uniref:Alpha-glucuronidase n=1 Tax=Aspergillus mulundensis TaxID=1810919 RepID=A0A3D8SD03_9EURO|nr:Alpha-glucuronidase A [Aspergillus mulundensis]RDW84220.1 Alpha-glucuronidase A [Aspergillus mulundensis]
MKIALVIAFLGLAVAEDGLAAWLRYAPVPNAEPYHNHLPSVIVPLNATQQSPVYTAARELQDGIGGIFGKRLTIEADTDDQTLPAVTVGTVTAYAEEGGDISGLPDLIEDGFYLEISCGNVLILGQNERGALYGTFQYLERLAQGEVLDTSFASNPDAPIRWVNQWDNLQDGGTHGSVERGYGGDSIFFWDGQVREDLTRAGQYARLLASIGINAVVVNNVNANETILTAENMDGLARIADAFRPYGIQLGLSLNFASPQSLGGLDTFDPLDEEVITWWEDITDELYARIPDMAGYLVKANSEGQPGPFTYNRTLADGANLFARALQPHGGVIMFRAFVYDHQSLNQTLDWKADRANAAVQFFDGLDSEFEDNVVIQIKNGPIDFQVREPVSPLFAHLAQTGSAVELQVTQEYLGQQCHLVYLASMWKEVLDFDLRVNGKDSVVSDIVSGKRHNNTLGGYAGVVNVGLNSTWLGSHLAMSNLYAYGKLAWDPSADSAEMLQRWIKMTFSHDQEVVDVITQMSMESWPAYEDYTGNLGIQTLTDILLGHYGPNPASQDGNPWGQWTRADADSIGMDRTVWNGTGNAGQYPEEVYEMYENIETTPDNLLLWFHHVPYTQLLKGGKSVIQHFYDAHYRGSAVAQTFVPLWESLKGKIDEERFDHVLFRLVYQAGHSLVWRDSITTFYHDKSSIPDEAGRVGNHRYRIEAEDMELDGYEPYLVSPFEAASGSYCIVTADNSTEGRASVALTVESGTYNVAVNYFDQAIGNSTWQLFLDDDLIGEWKGDLEYILGRAPSPYIDGQTATRITFKEVYVESRSTLTIVGVPDGKEPAPVDYISILPEGVID